MKKLVYKLFSLVFIAGVYTSCDDSLDQIPFDNLSSDTAFITAADFENGIRGVYSGLTAAGYYGSSDAGSLISFPDVISDNVTLAQRGRRSKQYLHEFQYLPSATMTGFYINAYSVIFRANNILFQLDDFNGESKANIAAEARALRAMAHFDLVRTFGKIPTQAADANGSLGVAYVTEPDPLIEPARNTVGEVYQNIVNDLTFAAANINTDNEVGRMSRDAVNVLLSRVYLYMGQWQNAINAANNVSTPIAPRSTVPGIWQDTEDAGVVFKIPVEETIFPNFNIGVTWSQGNVTTLIPEYVVAFDFYNLFSDDDIRKEAYTMQGSNTSNQTTLQFNAIKKLFGRPGEFNGKVDIKSLRAEEALLNKAEAQFELGQTAQALTTLNQLRDQRYTSYTGGETGNALRDAIRLERRLEFAFEYQRFFDLKRWGLSIQRGGFGDLADGTGTPSENQTLQAGDIKFQLPFSSTSLDLNPNLVQNPGY